MSGKRNALKPARQLTQLIIVLLKAYMIFVMQCKANAWQRGVPAISQKVKVVAWNISSRHQDIVVY
jgi:hypothetical protein